MRRLQNGKIPIDILDRAVLRFGGSSSAEVMVGPEAGVDVAVLKHGDGFVVVSTDPITGASEDIGTYAVRVCANDVATSGNAPQFATSVVLLQEGATEADLTAITKQIHEAAADSGIAVLGGHTEVTPGLARPIVVMTVFAFTERYVTSADARAWDTILMTKTAGIEGTSELAREKTLSKVVPQATLRRARALIGNLDVTPEAIAAFRTGAVHAMHDCTEGGVLGAVYEMSLASGLGFNLIEEAVPVSPETREICDRLSVDPLRLIGSGALLIAVAPGSEATVARALKGICRVTKIGEFAPKGKKLLRRDGTAQVVRKAPEDELWRVLSRRGRRV